jgi:3-dehydroquinate synthase
MGTGKSTVGRLLAERLGYRFVDTDDLIVARDGRTIADIFKEEGEARFRQWERDVSLELADAEQTVIATGGRLMLDEENAAALMQNGRVFCLTAPPEEILARVQQDEGKRPLLNMPDPIHRIEILLEQRREAYGRFPQINTFGQTPAQIARKIEEMMTHSSHTLPVTHPAGQYDVLVGENLLPRLRELAQIEGAFAVVTDSNVGPLHGGKIPGALTLVTVPAGEANKTLDTVRFIYDQLFAAGLDRTGTLVALGGGVVGDMTGFVAATYMRGIDFVQCPTTLLAMVDASVGGKTGVDMPQGKNLVGAFKQPTAVLADLTTLQTLPPAEFTSGMAEVVKHSLLVNSGLFQRLKSEDWRLSANDQSLIFNLHSLITDAIQVKRDVVQEDPFEQGRRAALNLGHTFGHAIEQVSGYAVRHGEGVAMGLVAAANLSARLGECDPALQSRIEAVLENVGLPTRIPADLPPEALYRAMGSDKKKAAGVIRFVLIREVGDVFVRGDVDEADVAAAITAVQEQHE